MSEKKQLNEEQLEKVSGGASYSDEVEKSNIRDYNNTILFFVGNQINVNTSYKTYIEVCALLKRVYDKMFECYEWEGTTLITGNKYISKCVYSVEVISGNQPAGSKIDLISDEIKVYRNQNQ